MQARRLCYTEKAQNAWHRRGPQKTGNTYNQRNRPSTDTPHKPSTKHYRKGSPGDAQHQLTQQPCMLQHNNNPPSLPAPNRVITRSSQPTQPAAKPRSNTQAGRAALHHRHHPPQRGHAWCGVPVHSVVAPPGISYTIARVNRQNHSVNYRTPSAFAPQTTGFHAPTLAFVLRIFLGRQSTPRDEERIAAHPSFSTYALQLTPVPGRFPEGKLHGLAMAAVSSGRLLPGTSDCNHAAGVQHGLPGVWRIHHRTRGGMPCRADGRPA